jgi:hypothetical protein
MMSPVSMTLVACFAGVIDTGKYVVHASPVSLTPFFAGVVDTGEAQNGKSVTGKELFTGVNDTGNACIAGVVDTGKALK